MSSEVSSSQPSSAPVPAPVASTPEAKVSPVPVDNLASTNSPSEAADLESREDTNFSARFAAIARKEREVMKRDKETKAKLQDPGYQAWLAANKERNPIKALQALGFKDLQEAAQYVLNDGKLTTEQQIEELKKQIQSKEERERELAAESQKKYIDDTIAEHKRQIAAHIDTSGDTYELIKLHGAEEQVFEVIEEYFRKNQQVLPINDACEHVENYLLENSRKLLSAKKLSPKPQEPIAAQASPAARNQILEPKTVGSPKTLTNATAIAAPGKSSYLSDDESKAAAAELLRKAFAEQRQNRA